MPEGQESSPEHLLQLARAGRAAALGQLLEQFSPYLALLARLQIGRRLQGKADAADLVQETFLEAHRNFPRFRGRTEAEFVAWIRQILAGRLALLLRRYLGTQRCDECGVFCKRVGPGGPCPHCDEPVAVADLIA